jgi:hypothetical protein
VSVLFLEKTMNNPNFAIILSDPGTKDQFKKDQVTLKIKRTYHFNKAVGYVTEEKNSVTLMLLIKNENFLPRVYYLDIEGSFKDNPDLLPILNGRGNDFGNHIEATIKVNNGKLKSILWHKVSSATIVSNEKEIKVAEYHTKEKNINNNLCLVVWKGDNKIGHIEVWYGQKIKKDEYILKKMRQIPF